MLLGLSGSVAAIKLPQLVQALTAWADVKVVATQWALRFVDQSVLASLPCTVLGTRLVTPVCAFDKETNVLNTLVQ